MESRSGGTTPSEGAAAESEYHGCDATTRASEALTAYEDAFNANDADAMNALFAHDVTFVNFNGRLVLGREALRSAQQFVFAAGGPLSQVRVRYEVEHVAALDARSVILHARQLGEGAPTNDPMRAVFTILVVQDDTGHWLIRLGQNTPVLDG